MPPPRPPWMHHPDWRSGLPHKRRFVIWRFMFLFGGLVIFFLIALAVIASLAFGPLQERLPRTVALALLLCGIPFAFVFLAGLMGRWAFRRFGRPMAEVMAAADAVAAGDLSVRLREDVPAEMGRLARSFNH